MEKYLVNSLDPNTQQTGHTRSQGDKACMSQSETSLQSKAITTQQTKHSPAKMGLDKPNTANNQTETYATIIINVF